MCTHVVIPSNDANFLEVGWVIVKALSDELADSGLLIGLGSCAGIEITCVIGLGA